MPSSNASDAIPDMQKTLKEFETILSRISLAAGAALDEDSASTAGVSSPGLSAGADNFPSGRALSAKGSSAVTPVDVVEALQKELQAAKSCDEYLEVFNGTFALTDEFGEPHCVRLRRDFIRGGKKTTDGKHSDEPPMPSDDQVKRDMERDVVVINGVRYVGARIGIDGLRKQLATRILYESREGELDGDQVDAITMEILRVACRTTSSGDGLEVLHKLCSNPEHVVFTAASDILSPISIGLSIGAWPQGWGLGVAINVVNVFKICDVAADMVERGQISVVFQFRRRVRECVPGKISLSSSAVVEAEGGKDPKGAAAAVIASLPTFTISSAAASGAFSESDSDDDDDFDGETEGASIDKKAADTGSKDRDAQASSEVVDVDDDFVLLARKPETEVTEVLSWGAGGNGVLGLGPKCNSRTMPTLLRFDEMFELMCVQVISCGAYHSAMATNVGLLYTWGNGSDGALGHGDFQSRPYPQLVSDMDLAAKQSAKSGDLEIDSDSDDDDDDDDEAARERRREQKRKETTSTELNDKTGFVQVAHVACGGEVAGSHTVVVTSTGTVFSCGFGATLGVGDLRTRNRFTKVDLLDPDNGDQSICTGKVVKVACGGCFTLALTNAGELFSWGRWANGRLGLGKKPSNVEETRRGLDARDYSSATRKSSSLIASAVRRNGRSSQQRRAAGVPQYLLRPRPVRNMYPKRLVLDMACGEAHALAVVQLSAQEVAKSRSKVLGGGARQALFSWGKGLAGQLGTGRFSDQLVPKRVCAGAMSRSVSVVSAAAGRDTSFAIDATGTLYSWGGGGRRALGRGLPLLPRTRIKLKTVSMENVLIAKTRAYKSSLTSDWVVPHVVDALSSHAVTDVAAGSDSVICCTQGGLAFTWGAGVISGEAVRNQNPVVPADAVVKPNKEQLALAFTDESKISAGHTVAMPQLVLPLQGRDIRRVASAGLHVLATSKGWRIGSALWTMRTAGRGTDVSLLFGGRGVVAHKIVIALRCPELQQLVDAADHLERYLEVIVPGVSWECGRELVHYLYHDELSRTLNPASSTAMELVHVARRFKLPRLGDICRRIQLAISSQSTDSINSAEDVRSLQATLAADAPIRPSSFIEDLSGGLGNSFCADLKFVPKPRTAAEASSSDHTELFAHSCVVCAQSTFFRDMFRDGSQEWDRLKDDMTLSDMAFDKPLTNEAVEVELPYSFPAVVNFLYFLYTGTLPSNLMHGANVDASSAQKPASTTENSPESAASARVDTDDDIIWRYELMMEMLHMSVRLRVTELNVQLQSAIPVTPETAIPLLRAARQLKLGLLRRSVLHYISVHLDKFSGGNAEFQRLSDARDDDSRALMQELVAALQAQETRRTVMHAEAEVEQQEKETEKAMESQIYDSNSFPWKWFWLATAVGVGWSYYGDKMPIDREYMPYFNAFVLISVVVLTFVYMK